MAPEALFDGTVLAEGVLTNSEIAQCIKEAMELSWDDAGAPLDFIYPVPRHPLMRPEPGHVVFVSLPFPCLLFKRFLDLLILTLRGVGLAEGPHLHGSPGVVAEGSIREGDESRRGRAAKEGEGGQEEEQAAEAASMGTRGGHRQRRQGSRRCRVGHPKE